MNERIRVAAGCVGFRVMSVACAHIHTHTSCVCVCVHEFCMCTSVRISSCEEFVIVVVCNTSLRLWTRIYLEHSTLLRQRPKWMIE